MAANGGTTESRSFANHWFSVSGGFTCQLWKMTVEEASGCISGFLAIRALPSSNPDHSCETPFHENGQHRPSLVSAHPGTPPAAPAGRRTRCARGAALSRVPCAAGRGRATIIRPARSCSAAPAAAGRDAAEEQRRRAGGTTSHAPPRREPQGAPKHGRKSQALPTAPAHSRAVRRPSPPP